MPLNHFWPIFPFYRKSSVVFSGGINMGTLTRNGIITLAGIKINSWFSDSVAMVMWL